MRLFGELSKQDVLLFEHCGGGGSRYLAFLSDVVDSRMLEWVLQLVVSIVISSSHQST